MINRKSQNTKSLHSNEQGMVSIIVTMVLIILMTLIVLAMSQNANREQRQALDRQLSDQAFYNAESGINDWAYYLQKNPTAPVEKTVCATKPADVLAIGGYPNLAVAPIPNPEIDGPGGTNNYTCILYDKTPPSLDFDDIGIDEAKVVPLEAEGAGLTELTFTWKAVTGPNTVSGCGPVVNLPQSLPPSCSIGGLRIDIVEPRPNRDDVINNNFVAFLLPRNTAGGSTTTFASGSGLANQGIIQQGACSTANGCSVTINAIGGVPQVRYLSIRSLYSNVKVVVTGRTSSGAASFNNAQATLDSTGKATDVLRRVQVRLALNDRYDYPFAAIKTSGPVCKQLKIEVSSPTVQNSCPL